MLKWLLINCHPRRSCGKWKLMGIGREESLGGWRTVMWSNMRPLVKDSVSPTPDGGLTSFPARFSADTKHVHVVHESHARQDGKQCKSTSRWCKTQEAHERYWTLYEATWRSGYLAQLKRDVENGLNISKSHNHGRLNLRYIQVGSQHRWRPLVKQKWERPGSEKTGQAAPREAC